MPFSSTVSLVNSCPAIFKRNELNHCRIVSHNLRMTGRAATTSRAGAGPIEPEAGPVPLGVCGLAFDAYPLPKLEITSLTAS